MKKTMRKLIPAVLMLLISAMLVGTSTYAWFAMNNKVTVTGMSVSTKVSNNILISLDNVDANYSGGIHQVRSARLAPVSTIDGASFFYANSQNQVLGSGASKGADDAKHFTAYTEDTSLDNSANGKSNYDDDFQAQAGNATVPVATGNVIYGYLDYEFYIKATNAGAAVADLNMTTCNLLYNGAQLGATDKAWRVAVFAAENPFSGVGSLVTILAPTSATNFESGKAATSETALADVMRYGTAATIVNDVAVNDTVIRKVTVRLWIEGEDNTCKNENYVTLNGNWALDLAFEFDGVAVTVLGSTKISAAVSENKATIALTDGKLSNGETPATYAWKVASTGADITVGDFTTTNNVLEPASGSGAGTYYCEITTTDGNVYRTENLTLANG